MDRLTLLIVEDDAATRTFLADNLTADGFEILAVGTAAHARHLIAHRAPDLVLVDVGLPDASGLDLVAELRALDRLATSTDPDVPIVVVSGRGAELDRVRGLERGADDYLVKPFSYVELRERIKAILRRTGARPRTGRLRVGDLSIDPRTYEARLDGRLVELSGKEFALLRALASDPTRVFTKEELLRDVWGFRSLCTTRTLDSHACRLRRKLAQVGGSYVHNVWGVGYRLLDPVVEVAA